MSIEISASQNVAAVILAAGRSTRMGGRNKLLTSVEGVPMLVKVINAVKASGLGQVFVVTGHEAAYIEKMLLGHGVIVIRNPFYMEGMATSLSAGIRALSKYADAVMVLLGDMPYVLPIHIDGLLKAHSEMPDAICVPCYQGEHGNPVLWPRKYFKELACQSGDVGGRSLLREYYNQIVFVEMNTNAILCDIDTVEILNTVARSGHAIHCHSDV